MNNDAFSLRFTAPKMNADGDEAEVMLYGEIISGMPENWKWDKEDKSAADFDRAIKEAVRSARESFCFGLTVRAAFCARRWRCAAR